jgi:hypothetical protein
MFSIAELLPPPETVPTNFWNQFQFRSIPSNFALTQFPEFRTGIGARPHPHASCCVRRLVHNMRMQFRHWIPGIESKRNRAEFRPILYNSGIPGIGSNSVRFRNCVRFREFRESAGSRISWSSRNWTEFRNWEEFLGISEISSGRNSGNWMELVPLTELIPEYSTSRNRVTARRNYENGTDSDRLLSNVPL